MTTTFTPYSSLFGGMLIGLAATVLWLGLGKTAGISGIISRALTAAEDRAWRIAFLLGLVSAGLLVRVVYPAFLFDLHVSSSGPLLITAGLLVGFGTRLGNGCTSGHGVCGLARLSARSIVATLVFMATGMATVWIVRHITGAA